jgi:heterotetrameric sarcosine oxidase gamma subunit
MTAPERLANRDLSTDVLSPLAELPARARVVIVGGGIAGSSTAYHLTRLGITDVVVLERVQIAAGTTWHAAGLVAQGRGTHSLTELSRVNADLYASLSQETGIETGFRRVGSLTVARTPARMQELRAAVAIAKDASLPVEELSVAEIAERWPAASTEGLVGGIEFLNDGTVNPGDAALAFAKGAVDRGARVVQGPTVIGFRVAGGVVTGVRTDRGDVEAEVVVLAAGLWTSELARLAGVSVPLFPAEHVWVLTEPADGAEESRPFLREPDGYFYVRHYRGSYLVGAFEPNGRPRPPSTIGTDGFAEFGPDWDHFDPVLSNAKERVPELRTIGFGHYLRAPESFTPDGNFHLGEFPELKNLYVAAGFNSQGIIFGPGAGMALAEWILEGRPTRDLTEVDIARTGRWQHNRSWLADRTVESLGRLYHLHWPALQPEAGRGVRRTPLWQPLREHGAAFGEAAGWERAAWFQPGARREPEWGYDFDRPSWFRAVGEEVRAAREGVALFDLSTYSKFIVEGGGALAGLRRLCAADVDVPVGRVVYTTWCNEQGGIELDPTVTRLGEHRFLVVSPTITQRRTESLLRRSLRQDAVVTDVTSGLAVLHLAGPRSRELLATLTDEDLANEAFPFMRAKETEVGWAPAWALRVSYTGELGWELYVPTEFVHDLHAKLVEAGRGFELRHAGAFAFEALRLERGFRSWGHDVGPLDDPFASGLGFTVDVAKAVDFVGREALDRRRYSPRQRSLVSIKLESAGSMLWHGESVLVGGQRIGRVTSGAYGYTLGAPVGLAWIEGEPGPHVPVSVDVRGRTIPAIAQVKPFYDPNGTRLRS